MLQKHFICQLSSCCLKFIQQKYLPHFVTSQQYKYINTQFKGKQSAVNEQCFLFFAILQPQSKQSAVNHQAERGTTTRLIQNADGRLPTRSIPIMPRLSGPCKPCNEFCHFPIEIESGHKKIGEVTLTKARQMHFPSVQKLFLMVLAYTLQLQKHFYASESFSDFWLAFSYQAT